MHYVIDLRYDINSVVFAFCKERKSFKDNYLNLLFKHQDVSTSIFTNLFTSNNNSYKLRQNDIINFNVSFFSKHFVCKQQTIERRLFAINNIVK